MTWQPTLSGGTARVGTDSRVFVEVIETGERSELKLSAVDTRSRSNAEALGRECATRLTPS